VRGLPASSNVALMRDSGLSVAAVVLNARQQRFTAQQATECGGAKSKELDDYPTSHTQVGRGAAIQQACGRSVEATCQPDAEDTRRYTSATNGARHISEG
jgi:hypothetical protein